MDLEKWGVEELERGFAVHPQTGDIECVACGKIFEEGEVFSIGGRLWQAGRAAAVHRQEQHPHYFAEMLRAQSRYNTLTDNQKQLMELFYAGKSDREVADALGVTVSTVRHQRFTFREKAKQARLYLALYEQMAAEKQEARESPYMAPGRLDGVYQITPKEKEQILAGAFYSLSPLKLKTFSPKVKKKLVVLQAIAAQFDVDSRYTEPQVNKVLRDIYEDHATLRRALVEYGFMDRTTDGKAYWLRKAEKTVAENE